MWMFLWGVGLAVSVVGGQELRVLSPLSGEQDQRRGRSFGSFGLGGFGADAARGMRARGAPGAFGTRTTLAGFGGLLLAGAIRGRLEPYVELLRRTSSSTGFKTPIVARGHVGEPCGRRLASPLVGFDHECDPETKQGASAGIDDDAEQVVRRFALRHHASV
jgi:hypothetical protein